MKSSVLDVLQIYIIHLKQKGNLSVIKKIQMSELPSVTFLVVVLFHVEEISLNKEHHGAGDSFCGNEGAVLHAGKSGGENCSSGMGHRAPQSALVKMLHRYEQSV